VFDFKYDSPGVAKGGTGVLNGKLNQLTFRGAVFRIGTEEDSRSGHHSERLRHKSGESLQFLIPRDAHLCFTAELGPRSVTPRGWK
jgi:hypothetical protein